MTMPEPPNEGWSELKEVVMANKTLFASMKDNVRAGARNHEGARAYRRSDCQALAQLAATGCMNQTFYADAQAQLDDLLAACSCC